MKKWYISLSIILSIFLTGCIGSQNKGESSNAAEDNTSQESAEDAQDNTSKESTNSSADAPIQEATRDVFAMDTYMTVRAYGEMAESAVEDAVSEIQRLDRLLSSENEESEIYKVNRQGGGTLSEDSGYLVERALEISRETEGAFDIAIYPVAEAWGFMSKEYHVPTAEELGVLLPLTNWENITYDSENKQISFAQEGMKIDLGGIAKGYTSSRIMDIFKEYGMTSGLVNLGGNAQVLGTKPDGNLWKVAIQDPYDENGYLGILNVADKAVITSGGYERYFEEEGITYHHIIDPATGYPADSGLVSVSIVSDDGTLADGLSTSLFIMGKEKAEAFWRQHKEEFDMVLMTEEKELYVTEGLRDNFTSDYEIEILD